MSHLSPPNLVTFASILSPGTRHLRALQLGNVKEARALATEITERGARLYELLGKEKEVRPQRLKAVAFLEVKNKGFRHRTEILGGTARGLACGVLTSPSVTVDRFGTKKQG